MPPAQSGVVGSSSQSARASLRAGAPSRARGSGSGARGEGSARHARQNGVNTAYGVPDPVRTVHGSNSRFAPNDSTGWPSARSRSFSAVSTARSGPP